MTKLVLIEDALPSDGFQFGGQIMNQLVLLLTGSNLDAEEDIKINTTFKFYSGKLAIYDDDPGLSHKIFIKAENISSGGDKSVTFRVPTQTNDYFVTESQNQILYNKTLSTNTQITAPVTFSAGATITGAGISGADNTLTLIPNTALLQVTDKAKLHSNIVYNDQTNVFGAFNQDFPSSRLRILNPAGTFRYTIVGGSIGNNFNLSLPAIIANDTLVVSSDTRLSDARTPVAHVHSGADITSGTVPIAQLPVASETAKGIAELALSSETTAGLVVQASDTRLSDARAPTAHSHGNATITDLAYSKLTSVPSTFAPSAHQHSGADVTSGSVGVTVGGTGKTSMTQHALLKGGASNTLVEIAPGTDGYVLTMVSGTPTWAAATGGGGTLTAVSNVGTGAGLVYRDVTSGTINLKTIKAGTNVTITNNADDVTISSSGAGGGSMTADSLGLGEGEVYKQIVGSELQFRSLKQGTMMSISQDANEITLAANVPTASETVAGLVELSDDAGTESSGLRVIQDNDPRLTNSRTPTAHAASHLSSGGDAIAAATNSVRGTVLLANDAESSSGKVVNSTDSRLTNSRTPTAHKSSHVSGGGDAFAKGDDLIAAARYLEDVTDPASDAQRIWLVDAGADIKYWSDETTPVKHTLERMANKGAASGYASLDSGTKVPVAQLPDASTSVKGVVQLSTNVQTTAGLVVQASDSRLSDARTPTAHSHGDATITDLAYSKLTSVPSTFAPSAHASSHLSNGADAIAAATNTVRGTVLLANDSESSAGKVVNSTDTRMSNARTPTAHVHSGADITSGTVPIAQLPVASDTAKGIAELALSSETTAGLVVQASDTRLSDARTPLTHVHAAGDITSGTLSVVRGGTGKSTITQHALIKGGASDTYAEIAPGTNGHVLTMVAGTPTWAAATGGGGGATVLDDLTDVNVASPAEFTYLKYDGVEWVGSYIDYEDLANKPSPVLFHDFTIYLQATSIIAKNNWTGATTSYSNADLSPVIEACIDAIIDQGITNDSIYLGSIGIKKGHYIATSATDINKAVTNDRHGISIVGEGLGTTIEFQGTSGAQLDAGFKVGMAGCEITNMRIIMNQYVTHAIYQFGDHANTARRTDQNNYHRLQIEGPAGNGGMYNQTTPYVTGQRGILIDGTAIASFFTRISDCDFISLETGVWCYEDYATSVTVDRCNFLAVEAPIKQTDGSGQNSFTDLFIQGDTKVCTTGVLLSGTGKNSIVSNIRSELHRESAPGVPTACQTVLIDTGVTDIYITNINNVYDGILATSKTIVDNSGDVTQNYYEQNIIAKGTSQKDMHYMRFEDNLIKSNSAVKYNFFSGQAQYYDNAYDHYYKLTVNSGYDLPSDVNVEFPDMRTSGSGQMVVHNAPGVLSLKTINPTVNTMPYLNSYTYTIYVDGGAVKARNNKTGAVTSNTNLDPLVTTILASGDPSLEIQSGTYNLSAGFTGWTMTNSVTMFMNHDTLIKVPQGYTGSVFKFVSSNRGINLRGGSLDEQGTAAYDWTAFNFTPTSPNGIVFNTIEDVTVTHAKYVFKFNTTDNGWVNNNRFVNILGDRCEYLMHFAHSGTFTFGLSGCCGNHFENCDLQSFATDPQTLGGIIGVNGEYNTFVNCKVWDLEAANSGAIMMSITANARDTTIIGGILTYLNFDDDGLGTKIIDNWQGIYSKAPVNLYNTLNITVPNGGVGVADTFFRFGVSDTVNDFVTGDFFTLENSTDAEGNFGALFRSTQNSATASQWTAGIWFQTLIKASNDIASSISANVISAHNYNGTVLANRGILEIDNKFTPCYTFYPTYADFTTKEIRNAKINPTDNIMPHYSGYAYYIYRKTGTGNIICRKNSDGTSTTYTSLGPAIDEVLANTNDPSAEIASGWYDLAAGFTGWVPVRHMRLSFKGNCFINVPSGYTGQVFKYHYVNDAIYYNLIEGGIFDEQLPASNLWDCLSFNLSGSSPYACVYASTFRNMIVWRASKPLHMHTDGVSWMNQNLFENLYFEVCKYIGAYMEHTGTYTINSSGMLANTFINVSGQASAGNAANPYYYPAVVGGWVIDACQWTSVINCNPWDLYLVPAAKSCVLGTNANATMIKGGLLGSQLPEDGGTFTQWEDNWQGTRTWKLSATGRPTASTPGWDPALEVIKYQDTGGWEVIAKFGRWPSDDSLTLESNSDISGVFSPLWRGQLVSTNAPNWLEAMHIQGYIKNANDVANNSPLIVLASRKVAGQLTNRPLLGIRNYDVDSFLFYKDKLELNQQTDIKYGTGLTSQMRFGSNGVIIFTNAALSGVVLDAEGATGNLKIYDSDYTNFYKIAAPSNLAADRLLKLPQMLADGEILESGGKLRTGYLLVNTTPVTLNVDGPSMIKVDASGGARTVNLPTAVGCAGQFYTIIKSDSSANTVTVDGATTETINGALTFVLTAQYQSVVLRSDGANWLTQPNTSERTGEATGTANGSTTVFNIAHGIGAIPSTVFVECSTHTGTFTRTKDATNIVVTFGSAPAASPATIKFDWRAIA